MATNDRSVPPPARTRLPRDERRAQLMVAAQSVFVERGYHGAAMDDIAERAGVSKPVLYQHFPSKHELYLALLDRHIEALMDDVQQALLSTGNNRQRVTATIEAYFAFIEREDGPARMIFQSDMTNDPTARNRVTMVQDACSAAIASVIAEDAGLSVQEANLLGTAMVGMAQVSALYWLGTAGRIPREQASALVARIAWAGIGAFPRVERSSDKRTEPGSRGEDEAGGDQDRRPEHTPRTGGGKQSSG